MARCLGLDRDFSHGTAEKILNAQTGASLGKIDLSEHSVSLDRTQHVQVSHHHNEG